MVTENTTGPIDCACVIHGDAYSWDYVDRLYSMLCRNLSRPVRLHVYTEKDRVVPLPYIKHELEDWGLVGPKRAWWYKIQLFNPNLYSGPLLYFDLDVVIVRNIDWIWNLSLHQFWTVRDFKYLWRPHHFSINSSIMWFDTAKFKNIWQTFKRQTVHANTLKYRGDQDYLSDMIPESTRRFFDTNQVKSWRWECFDGGYNFEQKRHLIPGEGTKVTEATSVLVFHGKPKPFDISDPLIVQHWQ